MVKVIWWTHDTWWERRSIPVGGFRMAPRQFFLLIIAGIAGYIASTPIFYFSFYGGLGVFLGFIVTGGLMGMKKIKTVPVEMQILYRLRKYGKELGRTKPTKAAEKAITDEKKEVGNVSEIIVDDWKNPTPFVFSALRLKINRVAKVYLTVDGKPREEDTVTPTKPFYRLVFVPTPADLGTHDLTVVMEGVKQPLSSVKMTVRKLGTELLEAK